MQLLKKLPKKPQISGNRKDGYRVHLWFQSRNIGGETPPHSRPDDLPAAVTGHGGFRKYWLFRGDLYETSDDLTSEQVKALALERENKVNARLASAMAMDHVDQLSEHGRREAIPDEVKIFVWQRDGGACVRCGSREWLEFDHIIPLAMRGSNTARNLQLLCETCNRGKGGNLA